MLQNWLQAPPAGEESEGADEEYDDDDFDDDFDQDLLPLPTTWNMPICTSECYAMRRMPYLWST
eukprot:6136506-Pyramimonas_sp.AAC.1